MTDNNNRYVQIYDQKEKVKNELRDKYPNYEELLEYSTKAAIELQIAKYVYQEFLNASLFREFVVAEGSKEGLAQLDERMKDNPIYQEFMHIKSHENKIFHSFPNNKRHKNSIDDKKEVIDDWGKNHLKWKSVSKAADHYLEQYSYDKRTIENWIYDYAKDNNIKLKKSIKLK